MKKYIKRPIVIEAEQWFEVSYHQDTGDSFNTDSTTIYHLEVCHCRQGDIDGESRCRHCDEFMHKHGWLNTLEGGYIVCPGDWIIKGIKGEYYPCKPDIFEATYTSCEEGLTVVKVVEKIEKSIEG